MRLLLLLILLSPVSYALTINEVMYDPSGADANREWIEIYNNDSVEYNLSGWMLVTDSTDHGLNIDATNEILTNNSFIVIVQNISSFLNDYPFVNNIIDSSWTSLSNSVDETILLKNSSVVFDNITYSPIALEGKSLCRNDTLFYECDPTPGIDNSVIVNQTNPSGDCDISTEISSDMIFDGTVNYNTILSGFNCTVSPVEYWIEDMFGSVVRYFNTNQSCNSISRQWTPDSFSGSEAYSVYFRAFPACNDTNTFNNNASKTIIVKGTPASNESYLTITSTENGTFGQAINVDIEVYRGDTSKYAVKVYVLDQDGTKVSADSSVHAMTKYVLYKFSVPVQMKTYCSSEHPDGIYTIVAEGLDKTDKENITVSGISNCKTITVSSGSGGGGGGFVQPRDPYSVTYPGTVSVGEEFDTIVRINSSSNKKYTVYSYVYKGSTPVSEGFDGTAWKGTWTANSREAAGESGKQSVVVLKSRIEDGTQPGNYSLRVKIKSDRDEEITKEIEIMKRPVKISAPKEELNKSASNERFPVTGLAPRQPRYELLSLLNMIFRAAKLL